MTYFARPNQSSATEMQKAGIRNLQVWQKHLHKQILLQQEIQKNQLNQIQSLQTTKASLISLIRQSLESQQIDAAQNKNPTQKIISMAQLDIQLVASPPKINRKSPNKSALFNRSQLLAGKQKPNEKQVNYLANINEYKHKDLVDELKALLKQLNFIIKNSLSNSLTNSSLLMQSNYKNTSALLNDKLKNASTQEQQFIEKHLLELGELNNLPKSSPSETSDQVLTGLMHNLQKEQLKLIQAAWKYQKLQIQKMVRQNLQEKTIENMRMIYKQKKRLESMVNVKEVKSNKDIVKFGYTEKMISLIQDKTGFKVKMQ